MAFVDMRSLVDFAQSHGFKLPVISISDIPSVSGAIESAERAESPVVLMVSASNVRQRDFEILMAATEVIARRANIPVAILLKDPIDFEMTVAAIRTGCNGVIISDSTKNSVLIDELKTLPARCGVAFFEISDIKQFEFSASTNDQIDTSCFDRAKSKCHYETILSNVRAWAPVEHLIIYNVSTGNDVDVERMMAKGREMLGAIPGVKAVFTGRAVKEDARYRYTWLVRFVHPAVIDSYRDHPIHVEFANTLFRPIAGDRISIDFQEVAV